jgi:3-oxoacyl-[acyl-carrier-protein] synthase II
MDKRRVVVTGLGILSPLGNDVATSWDAAKEGRSGVGEITRFDASEFATRIAAEVKGFDPKDHFDVKEARKQDLYSQYGVVATREAWKDAKLTETSYDPNRFGCILGVGIGGLTTIEFYHKEYLEKGPKRISPFLIPRMISNLGPGNIGIEFGLQGVNFTVTSACTSATHAIGEAYRMIANGIQDAMVTGGSESAVTPIGIGGFCALKAMSTRNEEPQKASRPFDKDRDGFVLGEGSAVIILEEYELAKKRGAQIYGEIKGYGASCDAYHITAPSENGAGAVSCMTLALQDAGLQPTDIQYVNAHGTSTSANDSTETGAIKEVFGDYAKDGLLVSSTKSMTGHLLGAAGGIEAAFSSLVLRDGVVPPTINLDNPGEGCDLDYVPNSSRKVDVANIISNSFGFGGTNASIILGRVD